MFWHSRRVKKTRKDHFCICCGIKLPAGSECNYECGLCEGDFNSYYVCDLCHSWVEKHRNDLDNPFYWDEVQEMMAEEFNDNCSDNCSNYDLEDRECRFDDCPERHFRCDKFCPKEQTGGDSQ